MSMMLTVPVSNSIAFIDTNEERKTIKPKFPEIKNAPQYPSRGIMARIRYLSDGTIRAEYCPGVANFSVWIARKIPWNRWKRTGEGIWLGAAVTEEEADYIIKLTQSAWSEGGECEVIREKGVREKVEKELKSQPRTPEELFKEFGPYMEKCFEFYSKYGGYGSQTPHDWWQVKWWAYWIDVKRSRDGEKDFEAYNMFNEVWQLFEAQMIGLGKNSEKSMSVIKPPETVDESLKIVVEKPKNVINIAQVVTQKAKGAVKTKNQNDLGEQLSLFG